MKMIIKTEDLARIVAGLVREGIQFEVEATNDDKDTYLITLTGGF